MAEYAPDAIWQLYDAVAARIPAAIMSGVIGDAAHAYGYHRGRDYVDPGDYSAEMPEDLAGDGQAACGLDISWAESGPQFDVSRRLLAAAGDPRIAPVREFYGSTDGLYVCGYDYAEDRPATSDDSHLWHIHLSIHRQWANDWDALAPIADVICGDSPAAPAKGARMIEIFTYGSGIFCWTGSSLWLAPDIGYVHALQTSNLYAGDRGVVDAWFFDAASALSRTSADDAQI